MGASSILSRLRIDPYLPLLIATVIVATIIPARGAGVPVLNVVTYLAISMLFFLYGARLTTQTVVQGITHWRLQLLVLLSTFALFPFLGAGLLALVHGRLAQPLAMGLMFVCVLPSTVQSSIAFTSIARGNVSAALCCASLSNMIGVVLTPILTALLISSEHSVFGFGALKDIVLQLLLPFALGQCARPLIGKWIIAHKKITSLFDRGSILLVVYQAFGAGVVAGVWHQIDPGSLVIVSILDLTLLGMVLCITTFASRWLGFSKEDEITIVFCGSKKSMASGIPMANILFAGQTAGLIVLPLMLFHQAQLFACAILAQRYASRKALVEPAQPMPETATPASSSR